MDEAWDVRAVRGPLTAAALGLPDTAVLLDGAYLATEPLKRALPSESGRIGFIPHHKSLDFFPHWEALAEEAGLVFLDVRLPPRDFMERLWRCESVLAEAMHGAIFADAYGIPWVPVRLYGHISEFKWKDWWGSLGMEPKIHRCPAKLHPPPFLAEVILRRGSPAVLARPAAQIVLIQRKAAAVRWLRSLRRASCFLSDRTRVLELTSELRSRLDQIKKDYTLPAAMPFGHDF